MLMKRYMNRMHKIVLHRLTESTSKILFQRNEKRKTKTDYNCSQFPILCLEALHSTLFCCLYLCSRSEVIKYRIVVLFLTPAAIMQYGNLCVAKKNVYLCKCNWYARTRQGKTGCCSRSRN